MSGSTGPSGTNGEAPAGEAAPTGGGAPAGEAAPAGETPPEGKPTDWKAEARKWEQRAKDNRAETALAAAKATEWETKYGELETKHGTVEAERGELAEKLSGIESKAERDALLARVAADAGVPVTALRGADEAELTAHAAELKALLPSAPIIPNQGDMPEGTAGNEEAQAVQKLFGKN